jgi:D-tyrosyl-tRNA(Tyr) deacylase
MRVLIQRVSRATVTVADSQTAAIGKGLLVLVGVEAADTPEDAEWLAQKVVQLRIFQDADGKMNLSVQDVQGDVVVVSQFTLHAATKKGNRPSYIRAASPDYAEELYKYFGSMVAAGLGRPVQYGIFGAHMMVDLCNDGPVTIWIDSKQKE